MVDIENWRLTLTCDRCCREKILANECDELAMQNNSDFIPLPPLPPYGDEQRIQRAREFYDNFDTSPPMSSSGKLVHFHIQLRMLRYCQVRFRSEDSCGVQCVELGGIRLLGPTDFGPPFINVDGNNSVDPIDVLHGEKQCEDIQPGN